MIVLSLPMPPTINHYFARRGNRTYLPAKVREYRKKVAEIVAEKGIAKLEGRLSLFVGVHPATRARQDLDNRAKGLQDALTHAGVWIDDEQIDELHLVRRDVIKGGRVSVVITKMEDE